MSIAKSLDMLTDYNIPYLGLPYVIYVEYNIPLCILEI